MKTCLKPAVTAVALFLLFCSFSGSASAQSASADHHLDVRLISERTALVPGETTNVGLHFKLAPGWHIYWINAGDAGEPPRVLWTLPRAITAGKIQWPTPQRLVADSLVNYGYTNSALLIVPLSVRSSFREQKVRLLADVNWLVCREICIPGISHLSLTLPVSSTSRPTVFTALFRRTRATQPRPLPSHWTASLADTKNHFVLRVKTGKRLAKATFIPRHSLQVANDAIQQVQPLPHGVQITLQKSEELLNPITRLDGLLVLSKNVSYKISAPVTPGPAANRN